MRTIIDIIEAGFLLFGSVWGFLYYTGLLNYAGEKERRRKERVEKYGFILLFCFIIMLIGGLIMIIDIFT